MVGWYNNEVRWLAAGPRDIFIKEGAEGSKREANG